MRWFGLIKHLARKHFQTDNDDDCGGDRGNVNG